MKDFERSLNEYKSQLSEIGLSHPAVSKADYKAGWKASLEWVKSRSDIGKNLYMIDVNELDEELEA